MRKCSPLDRIEYDITLQISALQHGVCARLRGCVHACVVEIKLGVLRASLMYTFSHAYCLPYKMATFISKKGVIQNGLLLWVSATTSNRVTNWHRTSTTTTKTKQTEVSTAQVEVETG